MEFSLRTGLQSLLTETQQFVEQEVYPLEREAAEREFTTGPTRCTKWWWPGKS